MLVLSRFEERGKGKETGGQDVKVLPPTSRRSKRHCDVLESLLGRRFFSIVIIYARTDCNEKRIIFGGMI
jgi:hypothetical protein